jgi:hypothetical protein
MEIPIDKLKSDYLKILSECAGNIRYIPKTLRDEIAAQGFRYCNGKCKDFRPIKDFHDYCISECKFCKSEKSNKYYQTKANKEIERRKTL